MSSTNGTLDHLPHLDPQLTPAELASAKSLIAAELDPSHTNTLHPRVLEHFAHDPAFSTLATTAHAAIEANGAKLTPSNAVDSTRYEAPAAPAGVDHDAWKDTLKRAYTSSGYLGGRDENLAALEEYGKNAWLVGNAQVEEQLRGIETGLKGLKSEGLQVDEERRVRQERARGEMEGLREGWKGALGRAIEAEIAGEGLRREIESKRRKLANGTGDAG